MSFKSVFTCSVLMAARLAAAHSAITNAVGDAGGSGMALGVDTSTPRDGTTRNPFQQDATRFRGASAKTVGETLKGGANNVETGTAAIMAETGDSLPQVTPGGTLTMTLHQVNADGAGPYTCMINADGTGASWTPITVTQNVDGNQRGRNNAGSEADHPLAVQVPATQSCTGTVAGQSNVCLVRCENPARAGPFGGVVPIQVAGAAGAAPATPATPAAAPKASAPAAAAPAAPAAGNGTAAAAPVAAAAATADDDEEEEEEDDAASTKKSGRKNQRNVQEEMLRAVRFTA